MNWIILASFLMLTLLLVAWNRPCLFRRDAVLREQRAVRTALRKPFLYLLVVAMSSLPVRGAEKLVIESPTKSQKFTSGRVVVSVKVDSSVKRLKATVTTQAPTPPPSEEKKASATPAATAKASAGKGPRTVFTLGPVELPRGADHWSPEVTLASGENTITISDADDDKSSTSVTISADDSDMSSDSRADFLGTFYAGASIDSFASNETKQYIGYTAADSGPKTGYAAGVDFQYRLLKRNTESRLPLQLWLLGETIHGQRSAEVDCSQSKGAGSGAPPVCAGFNPETAPEAFLAVLRNSSSMEAYTGARLEFLKLNRSSNHSANLYAKSQLGFITVQNNGGDVVDSHLKLALGAIMTNGPFRDSYMDVGWGRTDLFALHRGRRVKVDGYVQWKISDDVPFYPFFQMVVDSDFGRGSDDVRSYYGINMDLQALSCLFRPAGCAKKAANGGAPAAAPKPAETK